MLSPRARDPLDSLDESALSVNIHEVKRKLMLSMLAGGLPSCHAMALASEPTRIVMVHGIFQRGYSFSPLRQKLEKLGCECLVPRLSPCDARSGIETLALQLQREIEETWGKDATFHIVAHSMGGLVSRYYLQELGGHEHCQTLITLATPHHGTKAAYLYPGKGAGQMRPNSTFLEQLEASSNRLQNMRLLSYRTPLDLIILPSTSSHWEIAENHRVWALAHPLVMHMPRVQKHIVQVIGSATTQSR
jgi:triacylglycerol lipase